MPVCTQVREHMGGYLYDELRPEEWVLVTEHLQECPWCRDHYRESAGVLRAIPTDLLDLEYETRERLVGRCDELYDACMRSGWVKAGRVLRRWWPLLLGVACFALGLWAGAALLR